MIINMPVDRTEEIKEIASKNYMPAYLALISDNANQRDAVLGNGTRDTMYGLGRAFSLHSKNSGESINLSNLEKCENFPAIFNNLDAKREMMESDVLFNLISEYAYNYNDELDKYVISGKSNEGSDKYNSTLKQNVILTGDITTKIIRMVYDITRGGSGSSYSASFWFNDVLIGELKGDDKVYNLSGDLIINLSDYNITEAGTYTLKVHLYSYYTGVPSTANVLMLVCD